MRSVFQFLQNPSVFLKQKKQQKLQQRKLDLLKILKHKILDLCLYRFNLVSFSILSHNGSITTTMPENFYLHDFISEADHIFMYQNDSKICCILMKDMQVTSTIAIDLNENQFTDNIEKWYELSELSAETLMNAQCYS